MEPHKTLLGVTAIDLLLQNCLTAPTEVDTPASVPAQMSNKQGSAATAQPKQTKQPGAPTPVWRGPWWH